jgi:tripartite motif-containing protein 71
MSWRASMVAIAAALALAAPAQAADGTWERAWGLNVDSVEVGTGFEICTVAANCQIGDNATAPGGAMNLPTGVDLDASGNVYVADTNNNRIQKFDSSGNFLLAWGEDVVESGEHETASDGPEICANPAGSNPDDICKIGATAGVALGGEFGQPFDVAVNAGSVYVADRNFKRIQVFDTSGNFVAAWGRDVDAVAVSTEAEFCMTALNCKTGVAGGLGNEFNNPAGVETDASGNLYVAEQAGHRIQKLSSAGAFQRTWGSDVIQLGMTGDMGDVFEICTNAPDCKGGEIDPPANGGEVSQPGGIAVDAANVYVADQGNSRVQKSDLSGNFVAAWGKDVDSVAMGTGAEICTVAGNCKQGGPAPLLGGEFSLVSDVVLDAAGNIYVADQSASRVQRFSPSLAFQRTWGKDVDSVAVGTGFEICTVAANCKLGETTSALGGELNFVRGLATDAAGGLFVVDGLNNRIQRFAPDPPPPAGGGTTPVSTPTTPTAAAPKKKCKKGRKLKKGRCVKKKKKKKK